MREGGGSSAGAGGGELFFGGVGLAWHRGADHAVAHAKPAHNVSAQTLRATRRLVAQHAARLPATVLIRPLLPAASVRKPLLRSFTPQLLLHGSLLAPSPRVNRYAAAQPLPRTVANNTAIERLTHLARIRGMIFRNRRRDRHALGPKVR